MFSHAYICVQPLPQTLATLCFCTQSRPMVAFAAQRVRAPRLSPRHQVFIMIREEYTCYLQRIQAGKQRWRSHHRAQCGGQAGCPCAPPTRYEAKSALMPTSVYYDTRRRRMPLVASTGGQRALEITQRRAGGQACARNAAVHQAASAGPPTRHEACAGAADTRTSAAAVQSRQS